MATYYNLIIARNATEPEQTEFLSSFCDLKQDRLIDLINLLVENGGELYDLIINHYEAE